MNEMKTNTAIKIASHNEIHNKMQKSIIKTNKVLRRLNSFVGNWEVQTFIEAKPTSHVRTSFSWIENGAFLIQHSDSEPSEIVPPAEWLKNSPFPIVGIIGLDDSTEKFFLLYSDVRGKFRVYQMTLNDGVWMIWRNEVGFYQRFKGNFSLDGNTIKAKWERSNDGTNWEYDFDIIYTKLM
jgi:hypothetical protein